MEFSEKCSCEMWREHCISLKHISTSLELLSYKLCWRSLY